MKQELSQPSCSENWSALAESGHLQLESQGIDNGTLGNGRLGQGGITLLDSIAVCIYRKHLE